MMEESLDPGWMGDGTEEEDIYKENILDHYKHPHNFGTLTTCTMHDEATNPSCGDHVEIYIKIDGETIGDIKFSGNGCAISIAATSMLTDYIKGKSIEEVNALQQKDILQMLGIKLGVVRLKCGMLGLNIVKQCIKGESTNDRA